MTDQSAELTIALVVADLLAARPTWRARTEHEPGQWLWDIHIPVPPHPDHRAAGALLLLLAPAGGERLNLSLSLRLTRPALTARWRALLGRRDLRAGNADLDLGAAPNARDPAAELLEAVRRADLGSPLLELVAGFDPTRGRWFGEPIDGDAWVLGHELAVAPAPTTVGVARAALAAYIAGVLPRIGA
jgi:hypothetical protein